MKFTGEGMGCWCILIQTWVWISNSFVVQEVKNRIKVDSGTELPMPMVHVLG